MRKGLVYSVLIAIISILYLVIVLSLERIFAHFFHYQSVGISIATAFGIGLLAFPLRNKIQQIMDRHFFSGTQTEIYEKNLKLQAEVEQAQRLKTASILASGLAHEIKNPLTAINTFSEYLPEKKTDEEFINKFSSIVQGETERINDLVNQLTDFVKPSAADPRPTDIHELIQQTLMFLTSQCLKQKITVEFDYQTPTEVLLNIDAKQVKQVLLNILLNAIEVMPEGGQIWLNDEIIIKPFIAPARPEGGDSSSLIEKSKNQNYAPKAMSQEQTENSMRHEPLAMSDQKSIYRLLIQDTGPGLSPDDLPHLFDPFFTKKDHGTGLGLSVSYQIIEQQGGKLYAENSPNGGACFVIELPLPA